MIRNVEALEFRGLAEKGRNLPLMVACEDRAGESVELFLKPTGRPELGYEGVANELLAALLAGELGLPICEPLLVYMSPDWIASIQDAATRTTLSNSSPIAFGSKSAGNGWKIWSPGEKLLSDRRNTALAIFAFDAFTGNDDRREEKPNLLVRGSDFRIIDHELCFRLRMKLFPRVEPWTLGNLARLTRPENHILGAALKGAGGLDLTDIRQRWSDLTDDRLHDFEASMPEQWAAADAAVSDAIAHVKIVRDRIDECLIEIERALT